MLMYIDWTYLCSLIVQCIFGDLSLNFRRQLLVLLPCALQQWVLVGFAVEWHVEGRLVWGWQSESHGRTKLRKIYILFCSLLVYDTLSTVILWEFLQFWHRYFSLFLGTCRLFLYHLFFLLLKPGQNPIKTWLFFPAFWSQSEYMRSIGPFQIFETDHNRLLIIEERV